MRKIAIARKNNLSPQDFARDHLRGMGEPVIVTDAMERWPASSKWTFEYLRKTYGSDFGTAPLGLNSDVARLTNVAAYIDHLDTPAQELPGFWVGRGNGKPLPAAPAPGESPPYLLGWSAFRKHPEMYDDIKPDPYFISDWALALNPMLRDLFEWTSAREYWSVYIGPEGSLSQLHRDFWHTHSYLAQIRGRKRAILFSPEDTPYLYEGQVDPEQPDLERFELFDRATAFECTLEPGEMLFTPPDWWHCVRALEKSITVSHNFFNDSNVNDHIAGLLRSLPELVGGLDRFPEWREALDVKWRSKGFENREA